MVNKLKLIFYKVKPTLHAERWRGKRKCFNLQCLGFVQTRNITHQLHQPWLLHNIRQCTHVTMSIHKAPGQQQWWVSVNKTTIGYFPPGADPTWEEGGWSSPTSRIPGSPPPPTFFSCGWPVIPTRAVLLFRRLTWDRVINKHNIRWWYVWP